MSRHMLLKNVMVLFMLFLLYCATMLWGRVEGSNCWKQEREALLDLQKAAMAKVDNYLYNKSDTWFKWDDEVADCCEWQGVKCDEHSGRVIELRLPTCEAHNKLDDSSRRPLLPLHCYYFCSSLPSSLSRLEALQVLDLSGGCLTGHIPPRTFTSLTNLTYLDLSNNLFQSLGDLPLLPKLTYFNFSTRHVYRDSVMNLSNLARSLPNLRYFDLSNSAWQPSLLAMEGVSSSDNIPSEFSANFLPHLVYLDVSGNGLSGVVPEQLGTLQSLTYLNLAGNNFRNPLPWPSLANLSQLTHLELGYYGDDGEAEALVWEERQAQWQCKWKALESLSCYNMRFASNDAVPFCLEQPRILSKLKTLSFSARNGSIAPLLHALSLVKASLNLQTLLLPATSLGEFQAQHPPAWLHPLDTPFLESLDVSQNALTSFPTWLPQLSLLKSLDISHNALTSFPASLPQLPLLERLDISYNNLSEFPSSLQQLQFLNWLDISQNHLNVSLHQLELHNSIQLQSLKLSQNALTGTIPLSLLQPSLSDLDLSNNQLEGGIPFSIGNLSLLYYLDLHQNNLTGAIPRSIGSMSKLSYLDLSINQLEGGIPFSIGNLSLLYSLDLHQNNLIGAIPRSIGSMSELFYLDLSVNQLKGGIPFSIGNLSLLYHLDLSDNVLSEEFPVSMANLTTLTNLNISHNYLVGMIPLFIFEFQLSSLDLSFNTLKGSLPPSFQNCARLQTLGLSNNFLSGRLPDLFQNCPSLSFINLSNNSLSGALPHTTDQNCGVESLDLSSNNLSGGLPEGIFINCSILRFINLAKNSLSSLEIPVSAVQLSVLILYDNELTGEIPWALQNISSVLQVLDLSHNQLSGSIPKWITGTNFPNLVLLMLSNNQFQGSIPSSLVGNLTKLQILGLGNNNLIGSIPTNLDHLVGMTYIDGLATSFWRQWPQYYRVTVTIPIKGSDQSLSNYILHATVALDVSSNNLDGPIPTQIGALKGLRILNLSHNALSGPIPSTLGDLSGALESLDLSYNQLDGGIPSEFCSLNSLGDLDLSSNHLQGAIPACPHLSTLNFSDNEGLCGFPLPNQCPMARAPQEAAQEAVQEAHHTWLAKVQEFLSLAGFGIGYALGLLLTGCFLYFRPHI